MGGCLSAADDDAVEPVSGTHQFTIRRYSQTKGIGSGSAILSRYFTVDGRTWFLRFYPDGYTTATSQSVALYVQTRYKPQFRPVRARFTFELLRPDGAVAYARRSDRPCRFDRFCNGWGLRVFVARNELEGPHLGVLHDDDTIRVRCTVDVVNSRRCKKKIQRPVGPKSEFAANAMRFFNSGRAPFDVKFIVNGVALFEAHGLVVAAQSEWFAAALYGHGRERWAEAGTRCVAVSGTSPEAFDGVLHYIYHDELPEELIRAHGDEADMVRQLFEAADMFLIERMKRMCARRLRRFIRGDTVRSIMERTRTRARSSSRRVRITRAAAGLSVSN